jgi:hypothetical protein
MLASEAEAARAWSTRNGIRQRVPGKPAVVADVSKPIVVKPVLEGLSSDYRRVA